MPQSIAPAVGVSNEPFNLPPVLRTEAGRVRRAGFELEFATIPLEDISFCVRRVFEGEETQSSEVARQVTTRFGDFKIHIDSSLLQDRVYLKALKKMGFETGQLDTRSIDSTLRGIFSVIVPYEVSTPPIPIDELAPLDELRRQLCNHNAQGTRASLLYAFGMHINPEIPDLEPATLLRYLQSFLLLEPWLRKRVDTFVARWLGPHITAFPRKYVNRVLSDDYHPDAGLLIDDYLADNPTRNRPLDMLPVLACVDERRILATVEHPRLVKPRPALHYRLPNCRIDEPDWTLAHEWNTWNAVERLASDPDLLAEFRRLRRRSRSRWRWLDRWPRLLDRHISGTTPHARTGPR